MAKKTSWLEKENKRSEDAIKTGKEVNNPSAAKDPKKTISKSKNKEVDYNYVNILMDPNVENRFRYLVTLRQGLELRDGKKKPTIGDIFEEMVEHFEKKLKV